MGVDDVTKLLDAGAKLVGAVIWPIAIVYIFIRFHSNIGEFISKLSEITGRGFGVEITARRAKAEAALAKAEVNRSEVGDFPKSAAIATKEAAQVVSGISLQTIKKLENTLLLWVDDNPSNNNYERQSLEAFGIQFVISASTEDALSRAEVQGFDAIISDMSRPPDSALGTLCLIDCALQATRLLTLFTQVLARPNNKKRQNKKAQLVAQTELRSCLKWLFQCLDHRHRLSLEMLVQIF